MKIQTAENTQTFSAEKDYLVYKLLPLVHELDPKWYEGIVESNASLRGRPLLTGEESIT